MTLSLTLFLLHGKADTQMHLNQAGDFRVGYRFPACIVAVSIVLFGVLALVATKSTSVASASPSVPLVSTPVPSKCFEVVTSTLKAGVDGWLIQTQLVMVRSDSPSGLLDSARNLQEADLERYLKNNFEVGWATPSDADSNSLEIVDVELVRPSVVHLMFDIHPTAGVVNDSGLADKEQERWRHLLWDVVLSGLGTDEQLILPTSVMCAYPCKEFKPGTEFALPDTNKQAVFGLANDALFDTLNSQSWPESCPAWPDAAGGTPLRVVLRLYPDDQRQLLGSDKIPGLAQAITERYCSNVGSSLQEGVVVVLVLRESLGPQSEHFKARCNELEKAVTKLNPRFHVQCVAMTNLGFFPRPDYWRAGTSLDIDIRSSILLGTQAAQDAKLLLRFRDLSCVPDRIPIRPDADGSVSKVAPGALDRLVRGLVFCLLGGVFMGIAFLLFRWPNSGMRRKLLDKFELGDDHECDERHV